MSVLRYKHNGGWMPIDALLGSSGTTVTVDGVEQATWDADTKLDTGKSMEYTTNGTLRVHQMTGGANGSPTGTYQEMRGDAFYTRSEAYQRSAQYAPTNVLLSHLSNGQTTSYEMGQIKYKPGTDSPYYSNSLPQSNGTLVNDSMLDSKLAEMLSSTVPGLISNSITSKGQYIPSGESYIFKPVAGKGYIILLKTDGGDVKVSAYDYSAGTKTVSGEVLLIFVAKQPSPGSTNYYSTWAISVSAGLLDESYEASILTAKAGTIEVNNNDQPGQVFIFEY